MAPRIETVQALTEFACRTQAERLADALRRLFQNPDAEAIHDVRVACRRLRVFLKLTESLFRKRLIRAVRRRLKKLLKRLGSIRDAEVLSERIHCARKAQPEVARLFDAQIQLQRLTAAVALENEGFGTMPRLIEVLANPPALDPRGVKRLSKIDVAEFARDVLSDELDRLAKFADVSAETKPARLHALRIEFKKLRYTAEFFAPTLAHAKALGEKARDYQDLLGNLRDALLAEEEFAPLLRRRAGQANGLNSAVAEVLEKTRIEQRSLRDEFGRRWRKSEIAKLQKRIE